MISRTDIEDMTDAQDEALLPCPFCGGEPEQRHLNLGRTDGRIACTACGARTGAAYVASGDWSMAAAKWNRRADLARPSQAGDESVAQAVHRVAQYLGRRKKTRSDDPDFIHGYDVSPEGGFVLSASDLAVMVAALAAMDTPKGGGDE